VEEAVRFGWPSGLSIMYVKISLTVLEMAVFAPCSRWFIIAAIVSSRFFKSWCLPNPGFFIVYFFLGDVL
jgi:hypothetical protein